MFDVIIGNPPYQEMDGGHAASAKAIYQDFSFKSFSIAEKVLFVTPSRWFSGGKGLAEFRKYMLNCEHVKLIKHFPEVFRYGGKKIFGNDVEIKGGVSYFLHDNDYNGPCAFNGGEVSMSKYDILITDSRFDSIIKKVVKQKSLAQIGGSSSYYSVRTSDSRLMEQDDGNSVICYVSRAKGLKKFVSKSALSKTYINKISDRYDVLVPRGAHGSCSGFGNLIISQPGEIHTDTYIHFKCKTESDANSLTSLLKTKFANVMLSIRKNSQDTKPDTAKWIPLLPFDRTWDDASVYDYLDLTEKEIALIEETAANIKGTHKQKEVK